MIRLLVSLALVSACNSKPPPSTEAMPAPAPDAAGTPSQPEVAPLIAKMQALNDNMKLLITALHNNDSQGAEEGALRVQALTQGIDAEADKRPGYGPAFSALVAKLKAAAQGMSASARAGGKPAAQALRHLHDQCLRCHDQAKAAANAGVCQLTD